jgi:hypothetical protein
MSNPGQNYGGFAQTTDEEPENRTPAAFEGP